MLTLGEGGFNCIVLNKHGNAVRIAYVNQADIETVKYFNRSNDILDLLRMYELGPSRMIFFRARKVD